MSDISTNISFPVSDEEAKLIEAYYGLSASPTHSDYIRFEAKISNCKITLYKKKDENGCSKALFQGPGAVGEASIFHDVSSTQKPLPKVKVTLSPKKPYPFRDQIGSDEVGTGSFFGPVVVCAAYVDRAGYAVLQELGVTDSKKMRDEYILSIGQTLVQQFDYSLLVLRNEKYNQVYESGINMNAMKAKMHNQCLSNLFQRHPDVSIFQDQFAEEGLYYHYLKNEKNVVRNIVFATKGETKYPSVALGSVIARYSFLKEMQKLSEELGEEIPQGAGSQVDEFAKKIAQNYSNFPWEKYVKKNFANFAKIFSEANE